MSFVFPAFLAAIAAIAVPIIIHLFYFRRFQARLFHQRALFEGN